MGDDGLTTAAVVAAVAMALVVVVMSVNGLVWQYADGAVRHALEEGARVGARVDGDARTCERAASIALEDLLGGPVGEGIGVRCRAAGMSMLAEADLRFVAWLPGLPDLHTTRRAVHRVEPAP